MFLAKQRNQANSRPQRSERKTRLLLLHVGAVMERVLFIGSITCLYSGRISWFNSMLVHERFGSRAGKGDVNCDRFRKGRGLEAACQPVWRARAAAWRSHGGRPLSSNPFFWHPFKTFAPRNIFGSDVAAPLETVALKLHDSCPYIPPGFMWSCRLVKIRRRRAVQSLNYLCVSLEARELYFCYDKLCIYTLLRWDFFFFSVLQFTVQCLLLSINASITTSIS